uniref:Secreted protein n=3 Tax=unclassified Kayfunavirus TaxID=2749939 RepID=A0AAU8GD61_9CAUD
MAVVALLSRFSVGPHRFDVVDATLSVLMLSSTYCSTSSLLLLTTACWRPNSGYSVVPNHTCYRAIGNNLVSGVKTFFTR